MSIIDSVKLPNDSVYNITLPLLSSGFTTTAGSSTSGAYLATKWAVSSVNGITTPEDGMTIAVRVPLAGTSGGIVLSIDGGSNYYPIVRNVNTLVTTNYAVGSTIILTFNGTQTAKPYLTEGTATTVTGCWQIADYDANTRNTVGDYRKNATKLYFVGTTTSDSSTTSSYATSYTNSNIYVNTSNVLYSAQGFQGDLTGNADTATSADTATTSIGVTATSTDGATYTATVPGITALTAGVSFIMVPNVVSTSTTPTLNVNSLGAIQIRRRLSSVATAPTTGYSANWLAASKPFRVVYDGTYWIAEGHDKPVAADLYGTLAVSKGGTGATDAATALTNLGAQPKNFIITADLNSDGVTIENVSCTWDALLAAYEEGRTLLFQITDRPFVFQLTAMIETSTMHTCRFSYSIGNTISTASLVNGANGLAGSYVYYSISSETWTFTLEDGSTVTKAVALL